MELCPKLEDLVIYNNNWYGAGENFRELMWTSINGNLEPTGIILPSLRSFILRNSFYSFEDLVRFLTSRATNAPPGISRLRFVEIRQDYGDMSAENLLALRNCCIEHLEVIVKGIRM